MKKFFLSIFTFLVLMMPINIKAADIDIVSKEIITVEDGSYYETIITESNSAVRASSKSGSKTTNYYNASGTIEWAVKVNGSFSFNGTSASCTSSSGSATPYKYYWIIVSEYPGKSTNRAIYTATANRIYGGNTTDSLTKSVTLTCSANGTLS